MASKPNILLIMTDQHNSQIAGFAGNEYVDTGNLDKLASQSIQFDTAICTSPVCTPSRMSILSGKDIHNCGAWNNHWVLFPEHITWPKYFANNGYRTCLVGKMHFGGKDQMHGFQVRPYGDLWHGLGHQPEPMELFPGYAGPESAGPTEIPESLLSDVVITRETTSFLLEHNSKESDTPWFVCASYTRPHSPYTSPERYVRKYQDKVPVPNAPAHYKDNLEPYARQNFDDFNNEQITQEQTKKAVEGYYACVDFVDDCIGELLDSLEKQGLLENTIVIYTSDHGDMVGQHGLWGKAVYYEEAISVPLLIKTVDIKKHKKITTPVSLMDLFPTCCDLAGIPVPEGLDGVSFANIINSPDNFEAPREFVTSAYYKYAIKVKHLRTKYDENETHQAMRLCRSENWKYVEIEGGQPLLFDMLNDKGENVNVAQNPECADICKKMRAQVFADMTWEQVHERLPRDRERMPQYFSGIKPSMPNQYMLEDGRIFDAEKSLYDSRWLYIPSETSGGIIPQQFG